MDSDESQLGGKSLGKWAISIIPPLGVRLLIKFCSQPPQPANELELTEGGPRGQEVTSCDLV